MRNISTTTYQQKNTEMQCGPISLLTEIINETATLEIKTNSCNETMTRTKRFFKKRYIFKQRVVMKSQSMFSSILIKNVKRTNT